MKATLQLALEALEEIHVGNMTPMAEINWNKAISAIKEALSSPNGEAQPAVALEQEPVAWIGDDGNLYYEKPHEEYGPEPTPLYTTPPQPEQEPACCNGNCPNTKDCEQAMQCLYTTPPQRDSSATPLTWVGLTDEDWKEIFLTTNAHTLPKAIEAKLKEKNT